jgi:PTS system mannitol-specific IIC component
VKHGKSILFMLESNPGPGLGVLVAYLLFGPKTLRPSVPAAIIIQFLGGIHEIYFPYVLMKPRLILASIAGGAAGIGTFMITDAGLVATPSPGSIFAYAAETPKGGWFGVFAGVFVAAGVSFAVGSALLGFGRFAEAESAEEAGEAVEERSTVDAETEPAPERPAADAERSTMDTETEPAPERPAPDAERSAARPEPQEA